LLSDGFQSLAEIRLNGCSIDRNLDCSGATLSNVGGYSLSAAGAHIAGSVHFSETQEWITYQEKKAFASYGTLRLEGATIGGDLVCSAGRFLAGPFLLSKPNPEEFDDGDLDAIAANCLRVGSDIIFDEKFEAMGAVSLISAHVGNDFLCDAAKFSFPGEEPVVADGMVVEGTNTPLRTIRALHQPNSSGPIPTFSWQIPSVQLATKLPRKRFWLGWNETGRYMAISILLASFGDYACSMLACGTDTRHFVR
jgi:hypothetical protein